jgi:hypothetical protein
MAEHIDDLTVTYIEDGVETVKQLDKKILSKGAWTTIIFKLQEWVKAKNDYSPVKFSIRRYQKRNGVYVQRSKFNISSVDQATKIIDSLTGWLSEQKES